MTEGPTTNGNCHWLLGWLPCALVILQMLWFPFSHNFTLLFRAWVGRSGHHRSLTGVWSGFTLS
ncbi:hypothetical protein BDZ89DRAFT_1072709 [Hymenopellis radicata]|nr:hypothetical protein BDZ89DRAFT_1072709 [Hymenopellis radicata]